MNVQRSHFRLYPSITLIVLFILTLAALLIILFIGLFSRDVFGSGASHLEMLGAFLLHDLASIALLLIATLLHADWWWLSPGYHDPAIPLGATFAGAAGLIWRATMDRAPSNQAQGPQLKEVATLTSLHAPCVSINIMQA